MVSVKLEMYNNDRSLDNCSGIDPTDIKKQQNRVEVQGPEYKCSDERKPLEQNNSCSQVGMVTMDADNGWSSELDNMPLSRRREMLVKDDGWSSELDNMTLLRRREMLLIRTQSARTDTIDSSVSPKKEEKLLNNLVRSPYTERAAIIQNEEPLGNISANHTGNSASELRNAAEIQECIRPSSSEITLNPCNEPGRNDTSSRLICCPSSSTAEVYVKIKVEPMMHDEGTIPSKCGVIADFKFGTIVVKNEENANDDISDDKIDHMLLRERLKLLTSYFHSESLVRTLMLDMGPSLGSIKRPLESIKPIQIKRPWKKKRTATGSVQVALEEDAPGLLRALADNGVTVDEIILYENEEDDELADEDDPFGQDSFSELEDVIVQLFSQRQQLFKMGHPRSKKDEKATYCLTCLFSLVEQSPHSRSTFFFKLEARCLQFRNWPVEWGWSRDLQSFIFIFERHRRIVLKRPEYGYATYFFELVDSLPIKWQIKCLVTTMKLGSCGRATLMENKPLLIGEDLSEGEARVLQQFGWIPNSGLGTMLNYCDRVVHDRRNEKDMSYWRSKIGKLLINGYNGGSIVPVDTIENTEDTKAGPSRIKLEMWN